MCSIRSILSCNKADSSVYLNIFLWVIMAAMNFHIHVRFVTVVPRQGEESDKSGI